MKLVSAWLAAALVALTFLAGRTGEAKPGCGCLRAAWSASE